MSVAYFFNCMLHDPAAVGSLLPSSSFLAKAMAEASQGAGTVLELGAGTGAITRALLAKHGAQNLVAVEINQHLALRLKIRFPELNILHGPAQDVLADFNTNRKLVIVSSLPFRSLQIDVSIEIQKSLVAILERHEDSWLVQYTYQAREPFMAPVGFEWERQTRIWRNIPPAGIWLLHRSR